MDIRYHFLREKVAIRFFKLIYVPSEDNIADMMTKPLFKVKLNLEKHIYR